MALRVVKRADQTGERDLFEENGAFQFEVIGVPYAIECAGGHG